MERQHRNSSLRQACYKSGMCSVARLAALALILFLAGCVSPSASRKIEAPEAVTANRVVSCADRAVADLARDNTHWDPRITHRDRGRGQLESGDFGAWNKSGFRVRVELNPLRETIDIDLKGAGPYFVDMGVEEAIDAFVGKFGSCVSLGR